MPRKKKKRTKLAILHAKMSRLMSQYVKLRDADVDGYAYCCTCGKKMRAQKNRDCQAGHCFPKKSFPQIKYEPININAQCARCNTGFSPIAYTKYMVEKYGQEAVDDLVEKSECTYVPDTVTVVEWWVHFYETMISLEKQRAKC